MSCGVALYLMNDSRAGGCTVQSTKIDGFISYKGTEVAFRELHVKRVLAFQESIIIMLLF